MSAQIDFDQAKKFQQDWMDDIRKFLDGTGTLTHAELVSYKDSKLGQWYYSQAKTSYGNLDSIKKIEVKQIKLHTVLKEILTAKSENQSELAEELYEDLVSNSNLILELLNTSQNIIIEKTKNNDEQEALYNINIDKSVAWDKTKILTCKTDSDGVIQYVNDIFLAVSGYESAEIIDKSIDIVKHSDMPQVIFNLLWNDLKNGKSTVAILKNKAKSGKFYWVVSEYKMNKILDKNDSIVINQRGIDVEIVNKYIKPLYKQLLDIEVQNGVKSSENFLLGFLEQKNRTFEDYIQNLVKTGKDTINTGQKSFLSGIFG